MSLDKIQIKDALDYLSVLTVHIQPDGFFAKVSLNSFDELVDKRRPKVVGSCIDPRLHAVQRRIDSKGIRPTVCH